MFTVSLRTLSTSTKETGKVKHARTNFDKILNAGPSLYLQSVQHETKKFEFLTLKSFF